MNQSDIVEEIISHIESKQKPVVLIYHLSSPAWSVAKVKTGCITKDEMSWLQLDTCDANWCMAHFHHHGNSYGHVTELVHRALALGFEFPNEEARMRSNKMQDFEMVRHENVLALKEKEKLAE